MEHPPDGVGRPLSEPNGSAHLLGGSGGTAWRRPASFGGTAWKGRVIRLSVPLLSGQFFEEIRGTLAHEMIHQWQFDVKKWCPSHGREFRRIMALMNADGLGITIYHTLAEETRASAKFTWHCAWCGHAYHRQRNTLSTKRHRCGLCRGPLQEMSGTPSRVRAPQETTRDRSLKQGGPIQLAFDF